MKRTKDNADPRITYVVSIVKRIAAGHTASRIGSIVGAVAWERLPEKKLVEIVVALMHLVNDSEHRDAMVAAAAHEIREVCSGHFGRKWARLPAERAVDEAENAARAARLRAALEAAT